MAETEVGEEVIEREHGAREGFARVGHLPLGMGEQPVDGWADGEC